MSELIGIAHLSKSESLEILPLGSFFIYNINGHKSQDARLVNMLTAAKNILQDFFNIFCLQLTLGK